MLIEVKGKLSSDIWCWWSQSVS